MSRFIYQGVSKDGNGRVTQDATVSVFLGGTATPADVYTASSGGTAVSSVTSDNGGYFYFWVDDGDYTSSQTFKITISKEKFNNKTFDNLYIPGLSSGGSGTVTTSGTPIANDFARFTDATTIEGRSYSETKTDLSLNNVNNTSDANKPVSTATQNALNLKADTSALHTRSHAATSTSDHTAGNHKIFYSNGSGELVELTHGTSGQVLESNGATSAPSWETPVSGSSVYVNVTDYVSVTDGSSDESTNLGTALTAATGGTLIIPDGIRIYISSSVTVPARTRILGESGKSADPFLDTESAIVIGSSAVLSMGLGCMLDKMKIIAKATYDTSSASNPESIFAGTGISLTNRDITIRDCSIYGFTTGVLTYSASAGNPSLNDRLLMQDVGLDNTNGVILQHSHDTSKLINVACWPYVYDDTIVGGGSDRPYLRRSGNAFALGDGNSIHSLEYTQLRGCQSFGYTHGVYLDGAGHGIIIRDHYAGGNTSGTGIETTGTNITELHIEDFTASSMDKGIVMNHTGGDTVSTILNSTFITFTVGIQLVSACDAIITNNTFRAFDFAGVHINTTTNNVTVVNNLFQDFSTPGQAILADDVYTGKRTYGPNQYIGTYVDKGDGLDIDDFGGLGTVTSVSAGNGMDFTTITGTGSVTMGTPTTLSSGTSNAVSTTGHTHSVTGLHTAGSDTSLGPQSEPLDMNNNNISNLFSAISSNNELVLDVGTSDYIGFSFNSTTTFACEQTLFQPGSATTVHIGSSATNKRFGNVYGTDFYSVGSSYNDTLDDLGLMSEYLPLTETVIEDGEKITRNRIDPKTGNEILDLNSLPEFMTDKAEIRQTLKNDCGSMATDDDIEELLNDYDEAGHMVSVNIGRFNDLTNGGLRQLDQNVQMLFEHLAGRVTKLETTISQYIEMIETLLGKVKLTKTETKKIKKIRDR